MKNRLLPIIILLLALLAICFVGLRLSDDSQEIGEIPKTSAARQDLPQEDQKPPAAVAPAPDTPVFADEDSQGPLARFSPEMERLTRGIHAGIPVRVQVGDKERNYLFRPKQITADGFRISAGAKAQHTAAFEIFEGREVASDGSLTQMAKLAIVNDTLSMAYTTADGDFLIEQNESGKLVSKTLLSREEGSSWGHWRCASDDRIAGAALASGDVPQPPVVDAEISLASIASEEPEVAGGRVDHPYFRLGPQYDASLKDLIVLMVSSKSQTGASSNLSSRAASYFSYAATLADVYERQLGMRYRLQELILIASDSGEPDIESPTIATDGSTAQLNYVRDWAAAYRPQATYKWGHVHGWTNVDGGWGGYVGWAWIKDYGDSSYGISVNERDWTWGVIVHEFGHNVGANHTSGGAMNPGLQRASLQENFFTEYEYGGFTAAKEIYDYMSVPGRAFVSGPASLRNPNEMPFGADDAVSTPANTPVTINPLTNDQAATPLFGQTNTLLSLVEVGQPFPKAGGTTSVSGNQITFTPASGFTGNVWFTYTLRGNLGNSGFGWMHSADVVVTVGGNNSNPSLTPTLSTTNDVVEAAFTENIRINPLLNDEGQGRLWAGGVDAVASVTGSAQSYSEGAFRLVSASVIQGTGSITLEKAQMTRNSANAQGNTGYIVYTPGSNEPNVVIIEYMVADVNGNQGTGTITIYPRELKAAGTVIGTLGARGNSGNTREKAFDNDLNTYFDANVADGAWAGLDLGSAKQITRIKFAPRSGNEGLMVGGQFQGSNTADFSSGVVTFHTVATSPPTGVLSQVMINNTATFRYVRYIGPNGARCNVAEVEFYTEAAPAAPTGLVAVVQSNDHISLDWNNNSEIDIASYRVYRSTTPGSYGTPLATVAVSNYTDTTPVVGTTYYYVVTAVDHEGYESAKSNQVSATATLKSLTYNGNANTSGAAPVDPQSPYSTGSSVTVLGAGTLARTGYTFTSWNSSASGNGTSYAPGATFAINATTTLYAQWAGNTYTVTFDANDGNTASPTSKQVTFGSTYGTLATTSRSGYSLAGWFTAAVGGSQVTAQTSVATNANHTLYARWNVPPVVSAGQDQTVVMSSGTWSPQDLSPALWLDATKATINAGTVSLANDGSGGGTISGPASLAANGIGTLQAVQFNGSSQYLTGSYANTGNTLTAFFVGKSSSSTQTAYAGMMTFWASGQASDYNNVGSAVLFNQNNTASNSLQTYRSASLSTTTGTLTNAFLGATVFNGSSNTMYLNGTAANTVNSSGNFSAANVVLGARRENSAFTKSWNGNFGEAIIYNAHLSDANRQKVEGYLAHKWGTTASLPAGHPYETDLPSGNAAVTILDGTVSDPNGDSLTTTWSLVSGPASVLFGNASAVDTTATFTVDGTYTLRLTVNDGFGSSYSDCVINVGPVASDYTVTYDGNGNTGGAEPVDGNSPYAPGTTVTVLGNTGSLAKTGYTFAGWNTAANGSGNAYNAGETFSMPAANTTLYAQWTADSYTVTFDTQGGSGGSASVSASYGSAMPAATAPTRTGYTFGGYYTAINGADTQYYDAAMNSVASWNLTTATTLYAKWTAATYTVTYDGNGHTAGAVPGNQTKAYGANLTLATNSGSLVKTGYTFSGWNTAANGSGTDYAADGTYSTEASVTLYAKWTANSYTITFDTQSGTGGTTSVSAAYGSAMPAVTAPTRTGYTFGGYYSAINGGGSQYYDAAMSSAANWDVAAATTLYAKWTVNSYTVTLDAQGGSGGSGSVSASYGSAMPAATTPTRSGYTFGGYYTSANGVGTQYYTAAMSSAANWDVLAATTLYAKWTANIYDISFEANGGTAADPATKSVTFGSTYGTLATTSRTGYSFNGWFTAASGGTQTSAETPVATAANHKLYAQWTADTYVVSYNGNGNTGGTVPANQDKIHDTDLTLAANSGNLVKTGYTYSGWNTAADGSGTDYAAGGTYTANTAIILYAKWLAGADSTWLPTIAGPFNWGDAANWSGGTVATGTDRTASFTANLTAGQTVNLDSARTIGNITFTDSTSSNDLIISGANALTLSRSSGVPTIDVTQSNRILTISSQISGNNGLKKAGAGTLSFGSATNTYSGGTTINAGNVTNLLANSLGAGLITFAGNASISPAYGTTTMANSVTINTGVTASISLASAAYNMNFDGVLSGDGTLKVTTNNGSASFRNATNTFTGTAIVSSGAGLSVNSLPDSSNPIQLGATSSSGSFALGGAATTASSLLFNNRRIELAGTTGAATISNNNTDAGKTITIVPDLLVTGVGNKTLTLGGSNTGNNILAGDIANGTGSVISLTKTGGGTWALGGTNTYSGATQFSAQNSGTLMFSGAASASPNSTFQLREGCVIALRDDTAGTVTFGSPMQINLQSQQTSGRATSTISVNRISTGSGSVLAIGKLNYAGITDNRAGGATVNVVGGNGYSLQLGSIDLDWGINGSQNLNPTTASVIVTGSVKHTNGRPLTGTSVDGSTLGTGGMTFVLDGTATGNLISGAIKNSTDFDDLSNANALALNLTKSNTSTWTLSGANTYTGTTTVSGGKLFINGDSSAATGAVSVASGATLGGTGALGGSVTIVSGGKLEFDLSTPAASHNPLNLSSGKDFTFSGTSTLTITSSGGAAIGTYTLITGGNNLGGSVPATLNLPDGWAATVSISGNSLVLNVTAVGFGSVDHFAISAIASPQTVGTPITGITLTAQDAANQTVTSFTGTVTFGGTGGFSGTSANFVAGVLTGVSLTPITAGSNLTLTVNDGSGHSGSATITTIQSPYTVWSGGTAFDADTNGDGVKDGLAWILGATNPSGSMQGKLPTAALNNDKLRLTFRCLKSTQRAGAVLKLQSSSDCGISDPWTSYEAAVPDGDQTINGVIFDTTDDGEFIHVIADIPAAGDKLFGRLKGEKP